MSSNGRNTAPAIDPGEFREALRARDRAAAFHLFDPNVRLIDVGLKIPDGQITGRLAVRAHLLRKRRGPAFEAFATHSPERVIDQQRVGFLVDIIEANYRLHWSWYPPQPPSPRANVYNPLRGGISISNVFISSTQLDAGFICEVCSPAGRHETKARELACASCRS